MKEIILQFLADNWEIISSIVLTLLYEFLSRRIPTVKNWSILDKLVKLAGVLIKNRRVPQAEDENLGNNRNRVTVERDKHIISVLLLVALSLPAIAQQGWSNFKGIRLVNQLDSTQVLPVNGTIYYNEQSDKFRVYQNNQWYDLINAGGGGTTYTFEDGLNEAAGVVKLGGTYDEPITITGNSPFELISTSSDIKMKVENGADSATVNIYNSSDPFANAKFVNINSHYQFNGSAFINVGYDDFFPSYNSIQLKSFNASPTIGADFILSNVASRFSQTDGTYSSLINWGNATFNDMDQVTITSISPYGTSQLRNYGLGFEVTTTGTVNPDFAIDSDGAITILGNAGSPGEVLTSGGPGTNPSWQPASSGGITNTAAINEIPRTDDGSGNLAGSGIESTTAGNLNLGLSSTTGTTRTIAAGGSGSNVGIEIEAKGTGAIDINTFGAITTNSIDDFTVISDADVNINAASNSGTGTLNLRHAGALFNNITVGASGIVASGTNGTQFGTVSIGANGIGLVTTGTGNNITLQPGNANVIIATTVANSGSITFIGNSGNTTVKQADVTSGAAASFILEGGASTTGSASDILIRGGDASGAGTGGDITISPGSTSGGTPGYLFITDIPTSCAGIPTGAIANVAGVLTVCP